MVDFARLQVKMNMIKKRRAIYGDRKYKFQGFDQVTCFCDHCKEQPGTDMHEVIARSRVMGAPDEIQQLIFQPEICGILCQGCHPNAESKEVQNSIYQVNKELYGSEKIREALERIPEENRQRLYYGRQLL